MAATIELLPLRYDDPRTSDLVNRTARYLGRGLMFQRGPNRFEVVFRDVDADAARAEVNRALERAGADWRDYLTLGD